MAKLNNLFVEPLFSSNEEHFETLVNHKGNSTLKRIISTGHTFPKSGWYCQDAEEWVCVLQGEAELTLIEKEGESTIRMKTGDYLTIPSKIAHKVNYTSTAPACIWLALYME
jgi:cupin 2 domain-containing protein